MTTSEMDYGEEIKVISDMECLKKKSTRFLIKFRDTLLWMVGEIDLELSKRKIKSK